MIRLYLLDGTMMEDRDSMHSHLYMQFALPDYYGRNMDALWDCLTEKEAGCIVIQRAEHADGPALGQLMRVLMDLVRRDPHWEVQLSTGDPDCHAHGAAPEDELGCTGDCTSCIIAVGTGLTSSEELSPATCPSAAHRSLDDSDDIFG